ncbi:unnamed protein product [Haemonchus placei]|uniref:Resolvase/invertase-type recombinase catalytic domain-containing protein n=1 Tax=Haemonchus placei TaxID=6290 RepID=A0A0N4W0H7_HAEPC|nr:unnamed protein product [Haemonchus placei]
MEQQGWKVVTVRVGLLKSTGSGTLFSDFEDYFESG